MKLRLTETSFGKNTCTSIISCKSFQSLKLSKDHKLWSMRLAEENFGTTLVFFILSSWGTFTSWLTDWWAALTGLRCLIAARILTACGFTGHSAFIPNFIRTAFQRWAYLDTPRMTRGWILIYWNKKLIIISVGNLPIYLLRPCSHRQTPEIMQPTPLPLLTGSLFKPVASFTFVDPPNMWF